MRQLAGCRRCGHVEMVEGNSEVGEQVASCPRCCAPLRAVGLLGARLLAQVRLRPSEISEAGTAGSRPASRRPPYPPPPEGHPGAGGRRRSAP